MKFGGSCLQSRAGLLRMIERIRPEPKPLVIVLSALKGVTDELIGLTARAVTGATPDIAPLRARHHEVLETLDGSHRDEGEATLTAMLDELERILTGVAALREVPDTTRDRILSFGERLSVVLAAAHLAGEEIPASHLVAEEAGILTTDEPGEARILARSREAVLERFGRREEKVFVVAGFVGRDTSGRITTIGRGGSDTTATFLASVLGGPAVLWKDTQGLLTGDPNVVDAPKVIEQLDFMDALELAHYGLPAIAAKAIHPARRAGIPIEIHPFLEDGTPSVIGNVRTSQLAISCVPRVAMIDLIEASDGAVASDLDHGGGEPAEPRPGRVLFALARLLDGLAEAGIAPLLLTEASPAGEATIVVRADDQLTVERILAHRQTGLEVQIRTGLAAVSLIGSPMRGRIGFAADVFSCLAAEKVNIDAIAQTASERNISVIVDTGQAKTAVRALHRKFVEEA